MLITHRQSLLSSISSGCIFSSSSSDSSYQQNDQILHANNTRSGHKTFVPYLERLKKCCVNERTEGKIQKRRESTFSLRLFHAAFFTGHTTYLFLGLLTLRFVCDIFNETKTVEYSSVFSTVENSTIITSIFFWHFVLALFSWNNQ